MPIWLALQLASENHPSKTRYGDDMRHACILEVLQQVI